MKNQIRLYSANLINDRLSLFIVEKALRGLGTLILIYLLTKYFSKEIFGIYSYFESISILILGLSTLSLNQILIREFTIKKFKSTELISTGFTLNILAFFLIVVISSFFLKLDKPIELFTYFSFISTTSLSVFSSLHSYFEKVNKVKNYLLPQLSVFIIFLIIKIFSLMIFENLYLFLSLIICESLSQILVNILIFKRCNFNYFKHFNKNLAYKLLKSCLPLALTSIAVLLISRFDQIFIKKILGYEYSAEYSAIFRLFEYSFILPTIYLKSRFPILSKDFQTNSLKFKESIMKTFKILLTYSIVTMLFLNLFGETILKLIFNFQFSNVIIIKILSPIILFYVILIITNNIIILYNKEILYFIRSIIGLILNIILNILLIKSFGILGAAISTLITYFSISILFNFFNKTLFKKIL